MISHALPILSNRPRKREGLPCQVWRYIRSSLTTPPTYAPHHHPPHTCKLELLTNRFLPPPAPPSPGNFRDTMASYSTNLRSVLRGLRANLALPVAEAAARVKQQPGGGGTGGWQGALRGGEPAGARARTIGVCKA